MDRKEVFKIVNEIFQDVFDDNVTVIDTTTSEDIEDWDSFEHINLIVAIESEFKISFDMGEIPKLKNVGEMVDLILSKL